MAGCVRAVGSRRFFAQELGIANTADLPTVKLLMRASNSIARREPTSARPKRVLRACSYWRHRYPFEERLGSEIRLFRCASVFTSAARPDELKQVCLHRLAATRLPLPMGREFHQQRTNLRIRSKGLTKSDTKSPKPLDARRKISADSWTNRMANEKIWPNCVLLSHNILLCYTANRCPINNSVASEMSIPLRIHVVRK